MAGGALRREQADADFAVGAAFVLEHQREALHAAIAAGQERRQVGGQPSQRKQQRLVGFDLVIELDALFEDVRRPV